MKQRDIADAYRMDRSDGAGARGAYRTDDDKFNVIAFCTVLLITSDEAGKVLKQELGGQMA